MSIFLFTMTTDKAMSFETLLNIQRDTFRLIVRTIFNFNKIKKDIEEKELIY